MDGTGQGYRVSRGGRGTPCTPAPPLAAPSPAAPVVYEGVGAEAVVQRVDWLHTNSHRHSRVKVALRLRRLACGLKGSRSVAAIRSDKILWHSCGATPIACASKQSCNPRTKLQHDMLSTTTAATECYTGPALAVPGLTVVPHQHNVGHGGAAAVVSHKVAQRGHARLVGHAQQRELQQAGGVQHRNAVSAEETAARLAQGGSQEAKGKCHSTSHCLPGCAAPAPARALWVGGRGPQSRAAVLQRRARRSTFS